MPPQRPWPSSVPVGHCGAGTWPGLQPPSAARVATTSADGAAFAATRLRDRHATTCRPLGFKQGKRAVRAVTLESQRLLLLNLFFILKEYLLLNGLTLAIFFVDFRWKNVYFCFTSNENYHFSSEKRLHPTRVVDFPLGKRHSEKKSWKSSMILTKKITTTTVNPGNRRGFLRVKPNCFIFLFFSFFTFSFLFIFSFFIFLFNFFIFSVFFFFSIFHFSSLSFIFFHFLFLSFSFSFMFFFFFFVGYSKSDFFGQQFRYDCY